MCIKIVNKLSFIAPSSRCAPGSNDMQSGSFWFLLADGTNARLDDVVLRGVHGRVAADVKKYHEDGCVIITFQNIDVDSVELKVDQKVVDVVGRPRNHKECDDNHCLDDVHQDNGYEERLPVEYYQRSCWHCYQETLWLFYE